MAVQKKRENVIFKNVRPLLVFNLLNNTVCKPSSSPEKKYVK